MGVLEILHELGVVVQMLITSLSPWAVYVFGFITTYPIQLLQGLFTLIVLTMTYKAYHDWDGYFMWFMWPHKKPIRSFACRVFDLANHNSADAIIQGRFLFGDFTLSGIEATTLIDQLGRMSNDPIGNLGNGSEQVERRHASFIRKLREQLVLARDPGSDGGAAITRKELTTAAIIAWDEYQREALQYIDRKLTMTYRELTESDR